MIDDGKLTLKDYFQNRTLVMIIFVIFIIVLALSSLIASQRYYQQKQLHQNIQQYGVAVMATSYHVHCEGSSRRGIQVRFYRYFIGQKEYKINARPEQKLDFCDKNTLGDTITVYYVANKPYQRLTKQNLEQGVSVWEYYFGVIYATLLFVLMTVGFKYKHYLESKKQYESR